MVMVRSLNLRWHHDVLRNDRSDPVGGVLDSMDEVVGTLRDPENLRPLLLDPRPGNHGSVGGTWTAARGRRRRRRRAQWITDGDAEGEGFGIGADCGAPEAHGWRSAMAAQGFRASLPSAQWITDSYAAGGGLEIRRVWGVSLILLEFRLYFSF